MEININKKYKTVSGEDVILYTTEGINANRPVIGEIIRKKLENTSELNSWNKYGLNFKNGADDLVEVVINHKKTSYVNVYMHDDLGIVFSGFNTPEEALEFRGKDCIATKKIDIEFYEGEGL